MTTRRILVVEDDPEWQEIIVSLTEKVLRETGQESYYTIIPASTPQEARQAIQEARQAIQEDKETIQRGIDLITLDINLTGKKGAREGMELLDEINRLLPQACTIMISGERKGYDRIARDKYGVIDFLDKYAFEEKEFKKVVKKVIEDTLRYAEALRLLDSKRWKDWKKAVKIWDELTSPASGRGKFAYPKNIKSEYRSRLDDKTKLPTRQAIKEELKYLISQAHWAMLSIGIKHFDEFKQVYGPFQADNFLEWVARIIKQAVDEKGTPDDFVGCEGEAEFVIITVPKKSATLEKQIVETFAQEVGTFYDFRDRENRYIIVQGQQVPLMSIVFGVISSGEHKFSDIAELSEMIARVRQEAKSKAR